MKMTYNEIFTHPEIRNFPYVLFRHNTSDVIEIGDFHELREKSIKYMATILSHSRDPETTKWHMTAKSHCGKIIFGTTASWESKESSLCVFASSIAAQVNDPYYVMRFPE